MQVSVDVQGVRWLETRLNRFAMDLGADVRKIYYDQGRLWMLDLMRKSNTLKIGESKEAVVGDMNRLFHVIEDESSKEFTGKNGSQYLELKSGAVIPFTETHDLYPFHGKHRTTKGGTLTAKPKAWVRKAALKKFIKIEQDRYRTLSAGWVSAGRAWAAQSGGAFKVTAAVNRNVTRSGGTHSGSFSALGAGYIKAVNPLKYTDRLEGLVKSTERTRHLDMTQRVIKRKKTLEKQFNQVTA